MFIYAMNTNVNIGDIEGLRTLKIKFMLDLWCYSCVIFPVKKELDGLPITFFRPGKRRCY